MRKLAILAIACAVTGLAVARPDRPTFTVVVMDPLALPLSCPCVKGYAQRDYGKLGTYLEQKLGQPVKVEFSESLVKALQDKTDGKADLVIGKYSVVQFDAKRSGQKLTPLASLTGKDGKTTQTGLVIVLSEDPAKKIEDLKDYKILYGNVEADEKHAAVMQMFKNHKFVIPEKPATCAACDEGALKLMEMGKAGEKGAAVISSYAKPLLDGCGTVPKGALRVIAETEPVPFVTAFLNDNLSSELREAVTKAIWDVKDDPELCRVLETKNGFIKFESKKK
ncbi:MAG: PhnD/SsuA/transferrin family substrate-binding protein [Gemmataceae bacterium]